MSILNREHLVFANTRNRKNAANTDPNVIKLRHMRNSSQKSLRVTLGKVTFKFDVILFTFSKKSKYSFLFTEPARRKATGYVE
jgi:hypothetical protein